MFVSHVERKPDDNDLRGEFAALCVRVSDRSLLDENWRKFSIVDKLLSLLPDDSSLWSDDERAYQQCASLGWWIAAANAWFNDRSLATDWIFVASFVFCPLLN